MRSGRSTGLSWVGLLLLVGACGDSDPEELVRQTIGPAGGIISSHDDVLTIVLQPGALSEEVELQVSPSDLPPPIFGPAYRVRPDIPLEVEAQITYRRVLPSNANAATVGAIARDDYEAQMGHWQGLPRLALSPEQQWVMAADDELSLYYGLLEDPNAAPLPMPDDGGDDPPPDDGTMGTTTGGATTGGTTSAGTTDDGTTSSVDPTTDSGPPPGTTDDGPPPGSTDDGPPPGTTDTGPPPGSTGTDTMGTTDGGMPMPMCGDGMVLAGELCFVVGMDFAAGMQPIDVGVGNFDADPAIDVVTLDAGMLEVGLLPGVGNGTLMARVVGGAVGAAPAEMGVGDFTGEGALDVAVLDTATNAVGVLAGDAAGGFAAQVATAAGAGLVDLDIGDFDGNAALDVGVLNATDGTVQLLLGGMAGLTAGPTGAVGAGVDATVAVGSLNAAFDGFDDVMGLGAGGYHAWATDGTGAGFIGDVPGVFAGGGTFVEVVVGDIDGDGNPDVVALDTAADALVVGISTGGPANFVFGGPVAAGVDPSDIVLADLDGDGDLDAVVCNTTSADVMIFEWDAGAYALAFTFPTGMAPSGVAVGELSGDGVPDVVVSNAGSDTVTVVLSDP